MRKEKYEDEWRGKIARVMPMEGAKKGKRKSKQDDDPPF
jgi:hypothetical protein